MKKKIFMLLMTMVFILTACGEAETAQTKETAKEVVEEAKEAAEEAEDAVEQAEDATEEAEDALKEAEAATEEDEKTEAEVEVPEQQEESEAESTEEFAKGELTADGWESKWLGIRYMAPTDAVMATEEELNSMMGLGQEILSEDFSELQLQYAELTTVYEMMCMSQDQVTNVMVTIEKLPIAMDLDTYISSFEQTLSQVTAMTYTVVGSDEVITLGEREFTRVECIADYNGVEIHQDYCFAIVDDRAISVTVTYLDEAAAENILSGFEAY